MPETTTDGTAGPLVNLVDGFVPVIDLRAARADDPVRRRAAARAIGRVCETSGFFTVVNHGVPASTIQAAEQVTREFFGWPADRKEAVRADPGDALMRGYRQDTEPALRNRPEASPMETFVMNRLGEPVPAPLRVRDGGDALYAPNRWPPLAGFREAYLAYFAEVERLAMQIMELFALALDLPADWFEDKFAAHTTSMAANMYPGRVTPPAAGELRKGEHTDWGTLTLLYKDDTARGLQVFDQSGQWVQVPSVPGGFVVNIGDLMARWTNDRWASTVHRVVHTGDGAGYGPRQSIAFFHQPGYDTVIECIPSCVADGELPRHAPVTFGDYLAAKMRRAYLHRRIAEAGW